MTRKEFLTSLYSKLMNINESSIHYESWAGMSVLTIDGESPMYIYADKTPKSKRVNIKFKGEALGNDRANLECVEHARKVLAENNLDGRAEIYHSPWRGGATSYYLRNNHCCENKYLRITFNDYPWKNL